MNRGLVAGSDERIASFRRLQEAIRRTWLLSAFHREHWCAQGVREGWVPGAPDELSGLPVVTKEDILAGQRRMPPWGGNLCAEESEIAQLHVTSGTSGIGQETYGLTAADVEIMGRSWQPQYAAIGLAPGDVAIFTIPVSLFCAGLSALEGARLHGIVPIFTGIASKEFIVELIDRHRAAYLYGTESFLLQLAHVTREAGLAGRWRGQLKGVQSVGVSPALLTAAKEVFGAPLFEVYGCTQAAAKIATTCRLGVEHGTMHFHDDHLFVELRHPETGEFVAEGPADIVLSTTFRQASPVIRFHMRDRVDVVPAGGCACGDGGPGFKPGTLRRSDSMIKIRGVNLWPSAIEQVLFARPEIREYRAVVGRRDDGADELTIRVALRGNGEDAELLDQIADDLRGRTMVRPLLLRDDTLPSSEGQYKVKRWSDERPKFPAS